MGRDWLTAAIPPMLAGTAAPFDSDEYLFEVKWDGIRAIAFFGAGTARIQGRRLGDGSHRYPEIVAALANLPGEGILDGELVVLDEDGRPDFQRVLAREQTASRDAALMKAQRHPAAYLAFDLLFADGEALFDVPLLERRERLSRLLASCSSPIVESTYVIGQGKAFYARAAERGLEGVVAKRLGSRYLPGERTRDWLKLKVRRTVDAVLVGLVRERGTRRVKSLVLAAYRDGELVWIGNAGSGLDGETLRTLATEMEAYTIAPPPKLTAEAPGPIQWLEPRLVVRVEYTELTHEQRLRQPVFIGFVNKRPRDCAAPGG